MDDFMNEQLKTKLDLASDILEIQQLQSKYMSALEEMSFQRIWEDYMAKDHSEVQYEIVDNGRYIGPEKVGRFLTEHANKQIGSIDGTEGKRGFFPMMTLRTPCIVVNKEKSRARGQWHLFGPHVMYVTPYPGKKHQLTSYWFIGKYDNEYIKIDGSWKILKIHVVNFVRTPWELGWLRQADCRRVISSGVPPTEPSYLHTYHPDAIYAKDSPYSYGPFLPDDDY